MHIFTLFELNEHLRRIIALNLPDPVWVSCELGQVKESRGHVYLTLVEKSADSDAVVAQSEAVLWATNLRRIVANLGTSLVGQLLQEGIQLKIKAKVEFHERYGMKLSVDDIDPAHTLGLIEAQRREMLHQLEREGLVHLNAERPLPSVIQRIALISSATAAGLVDFTEQLSSNQYGYRFDLRLHEAAMQGRNMAEEVVQHFQNLHKKKSHFDVAVLVRGGGSRLDLADFDNYELAKAIALCPLPVLTGIGHEIDETLADLVAGMSLKTPTAVAEFIIQHNLAFEHKLGECVRAIHISARNRLYVNNMSIEKMHNKIALHSQKALGRSKASLDHAALLLPKLVAFSLKTQLARLKEAENRLKALLPETILGRGYSIVCQGNRIIKTLGDVQRDTPLEVRLRKGAFRARVLEQENEQQ
jgi:exodeoxyribonuclease VII large subunit